MRTGVDTKGRCSIPQHFVGSWVCVAAKSRSSIVVGIDFSHHSASCCPSLGGRVGSKRVHPASQTIVNIRVQMLRFDGGVAKEGASVVDVI